MGTLGKIFFVSVLGAAAWAADNTAPVVTSAASPQIGIAADSLASIFGPSISTMNQVAPGPPWPTSFGDISVVQVTDSAGTQKQAEILFVSSGQMNVYLPAGLAPGAGTIAFPTTGLPPGVGTAALRVVPVTIQKAAPALFSAAGTGSGVAAATAVRVTIPTQIQSPVTVYQCTGAANCQAVPIDTGLDAPVFLSLYGTGIRGASSQAAVSVKIGDTTISPSYAGPQPETPGLDQVNVPLPLALRGAGLVNVTVTVDGATSNAVQLSFQ